tara:strand:+ start:575 stop:835 length:261 start_codon:yes stop_codon:yes gene_type:complete
MEVVLKEGLLIQKVVDELVILEPQSGDYFTLNNMGALMLEKLQAGLSKEQIGEQISTDYAVDSTQVVTDLNDLLEQLTLVDLAYKR